MPRPSLLLLLIAVTLFASSGASCPWMRTQLVEPSPVAFTGPPSLPEAIRVVNKNSGAIQSLRTDNASLSIQGLPDLRVNMALQTPRNFRLRANFVGLGQVLDLGSNDDLFWALVDTPEMLSNIPKAVYYARHDQFQHSTAGQAIPIKPDWLIAALGVVQLDPNGMHEGPYSRGAGKMEIRSRERTNDGEVTRVTVVHDTYGWIMEQHVYDAQGQVLASATATDHRYYPLVDASLPHKVTVMLPPPARSFTIEIGEYIVNQMYGDPQQLFGMPDFDGYPMIDLSAPPPSFSRIPPPQPQQTPLQPQYPARISRLPDATYPPRYRGY